MPDSSMGFLYGLLRASMLLSIGFVVVWVLLRALKVRSPWVHSLCWSVVLLQGAMLIPISINLPLLASVSSNQLADRPVLGSVNDAEGDPTVEQDVFEGLDSSLLESDLLLNEADSIAVASTQAAVAPRINMVVLMLCLWVIGIVAFATTKAWRYFRFTRQVSHDACDDFPPEWLEHWKSVCGEAGISRPVPLCVTHNIGPCVCWIGWETRLLIPHQQWSELSVLQRETVFRHELAHLVRHDLWTGLLIQSLACLQWFNPFAWLCVRKLVECSEWACDDMVRRQPVADVSEYVKALLEFSVTVHRVPAIVTSASAHSVVLRARRLLNPNVMEDSRMKKLTISMAAMTLLAVGMLNPKLVAMASQDDSAGNDDATKPVATSSETKAENKTESSSDEDAAPEENLAQLTLDPGSKGLAGTGVDLLLEPATVPGQLLIVSDDRTRLTNRIRLLTEPAGQHIGTREAVVDMAYLFKRLPEFEKQKDALQERVKMEDERVRAETKAIQVIAKQLREVSLTDREALETQLAERHARVNALRTVAQKRFMGEEAKIYSAVYRRIRKAIAEHARENSIDIVRRAAVSREHQERLDSDDPKIVLQALNADVLYVSDDGKIDITDAVLKRLTGGAETSASEN